jgi:hypothetical protein
MHICYPPVYQQPAGGLRIGLLIDDTGEAVAEHLVVIHQEQGDSTHECRCAEADSSGAEEEMGRHVSSRGGPRSIIGGADRYSPESEIATIHPVTPVRTSPEPE